MFYCFYNNLIIFIENGNTKICGNFGERKLIPVSVIYSHLCNLIGLLILSESTKQYFYIYIPLTK